MAQKEVYLFLRIFRKITIAMYQSGRITMSKVNFDDSKACSFVQEHEMEYMSELAALAKEQLLSKTGAGNDFLG